MRRFLLLSLFLLPSCVSVKSADGTCSASTVVLFTSGSASCSMINGVETGSASGLDIAQIAAMVAAYQTQHPVPIAKGGQ